MSINSSAHTSSARSPLSVLLSSQPQQKMKKADSDADDAPSAKSAAPKLATSGPGQILDRKV